MISDPPVPKSNPIIAADDVKEAKSDVSESDAGT